MGFVMVQIYDYFSELDRFQTLAYQDAFKSMAYRDANLRETFRNLGSSVFEMKIRT